MEKYWGFWRFMAVYFACGVFAAFVFMGAAAMSGPEAQEVPLVGASGAIAGAMGAFLVTHAKARVKIFYTVLLIIRGTFQIRSFVYFGLWFLGQLASALLSPAQGSGVAYSAHIGGFILGALLGRAIKSEDDAAVVSRPGSHGTDTRTGTAYFGYTEAQSATEDGTTGRPAPDTSATQSGWQAYQRGDTAAAVAHLTRGLDNYFKAPDAYREEIAGTVGRIVETGGNLRFPPANMYQWAKNLAAMRMVKLAAACFDLAALTADTPHLQKNSLLEASGLRIRSGFELSRARSDLEIVVSLDGQGMSARQAERMLEQMS
jgi:hypothetical protein